MDRKDKILAAALELFAGDGYNGVSTSRISKEAGVSEGLIFRHFVNKKGLLDAILEQAFEKAAQLYAHIIAEEDPKEVLRKTITLPFRVEESEYHFWKLQFKLKWELEISGKEKTQPLVDKLTWALSELNYPEPENEARILQHLVESISADILREGLESQVPLQDFLLRKYKL